MNTSDKAWQGYVTWEEKGTYSTGSFEFSLQKLKKKINPDIKTKQKKREYVRQMKTNTGCAKCGYKDNPDILHYHHIDPSTKINNVSRMVGKNHSIERILKEINKCKLLCITCHHKEHGIK